jgi:hypothetical protein
MRKSVGTNSCRCIYEYVDVFISIYIYIYIYLYIYIFIYIYVYIYIYIYILYTYDYTCKNIPYELHKYVYEWYNNKQPLVITIYTIIFRIHDYIRYTKNK